MGTEKKKWRQWELFVMWLHTDHYVLNQHHELLFYAFWKPIYLNNIYEYILIIRRRRMIIIIIEVQLILPPEKGKTKESSTS